MRGSGIMGKNKKKDDRKNRKLKLPGSSAAFASHEDRKSVV